MNRNKTIAGFIALFLGGFGFHKFYLKQYKTGIIYLLLCWTVIPGIISIFEAIGLFTTSKTKFNFLYNEGNVNQQSSKAYKIEQYIDMLDRGLISLEEFEKQKKVILQNNEP